jgi:parallel beta-helix repeat protein
MLMPLALAASAMPVQAAEWTVKEGETIQAAIDKAAAGDTVKVEPGVYREALHIDKERISLIGVIRGGRRPKLDGEHRLNDGIIASGSGFRVENLHVANYKGNGVMTQAANDVVMRGLLVEDTGIYGIYPTLGTNVLIERNVVTGIEDAGIYVGMCRNVDVRDNELRRNVAGIEVENSERVLVEGNSAVDNTGGILVFALPGLPKKRTAEIVVRRNFVIDNDHKNFGAPGSVVGNVPPGSGLIVLAADKVVIEGNLVRDNDLAGVVIVDLGVMPGFVEDPGLEPNPDDVAVVGNFYLDNGHKTLGFMAKWYHFILRNMFHGGTPAGTAEDLIPPSGDIYFAGKGSGNCLDDLEAQVVVGKDRLGTCGPLPDFAAVTTMIDSNAAADAELALGPKVHATVCSGCHAYAIRAIGPPIKEIQEKYKGHPEGIVAFASAPKTVRSGFPPMPPQAYLGAEKLTAVANYLLGMKE